MDFYLACSSCTTSESLLSAIQVGVVVFLVRVTSVELLYLLLSHAG